MLASRRSPHHRISIMVFYNLWHLRVTCQMHADFGPSFTVARNSPKYFGILWKLWIDLQNGTQATGPQHQIPIWLKKKIGVSVGLSNHARLIKKCRRLGFFPIITMNVEIVRILMRNLNKILLKYQFEPLKYFRNNQSFKPQCPLFHALTFGFKQKDAHKNGSTQALSLFANTEIGQ